MGFISFLKKNMFKSLRVRIIFVITVFMLLPVVYFLNYNFSHAEKMLQEKTSSLILDHLQQVGNQIENTCLDIIKISNFISADQLILAELTSKIDRNPDRQSNYYDLTSRDKLNIIKIEAQLDYLKTGIFFNYDADVLLIDALGMVYTATSREDEFKFKLQYMEKYHGQSWYQNLLRDNQNTVWVAPFSYDLNGDDENNRYISAVRVINGGYPQRLLGIVMVNVSESHFKNILGNHANGLVALINEEQDTIFSTDHGQNSGRFNFKHIFDRSAEERKGYLFLELNETKFVINYYVLNRVGWKLVSITPYQDAVKEIEGLRQKIVVFNIVVFLLLFTVAVGFIIYITNPLKKLVGRIKGMKIGDYRIDLREENFPDDVSGIVGSFDYLFEKIEELVNTVIEKKRREHELKYGALQAQITPHFLFNTLNVIKWSAVMSGAGNVAKMIAALGKLLEVSLGKSDEEVAFQEEIELIEAYVFIQNVRYNDKYILKVEAEEKIYALKLPKLILQPLVENAIIHGLKNVEGQGTIIITATDQDGFLRVSITDNGEGIPAEKIRQLLINPNQEMRKQRFSGIGLHNVDERLKLRYGKHYGIKISSKVGCGTIVELTLPIIK